MVSFNDADDFFETSAQGGGKAFRFTDIDGIGPATADKIKSIRGVRAPTDVTEMSADELADKAGISRSRAEKAIRGAGGNPNVSKRSNTGSVSAAGIKQRTGDFWVEFAAQDKARARNDPRSRSEEAVRQDEQKRAPITTDLEEWKNNKSGLDFPGVDTPTQNPKALPKDYKRGGDFQTTDVDEDSEVATGTPGGFAANPEAAAGGSMEDAFMAEMVGRDVPASPEETEGVGAVGMTALGGFNQGMGGERRPREEIEGSRLSSSDREPEGTLENVRPPDAALQSQNENSGKTVELPAWTLSRGQTYLNEKVYGEEREDLRPLREKVRRAEPGQPVSFEPGEYDTFQRIVREEAKEEIDRADRMEANIFGDTDEQAEVAKQALQGIINNPPR